MTFVQLEYIVAVDTHRHFAAAAAHCFVTQPTLSMQVQKLEEELGIKIFDRSKQPVLPTEAGRELIDQARKILAEKDIIQEIVQTRKGLLTGELRIGIIPTLAPYLLPLFIQGFTAKYPQIKLVVNEMTTETLVARLREGRIDVGILVTPLQENGIREHVLFYEELLVYVSRKNAAYKKTYMLAQDIDPKAVMAELTGRATGSSHGKGGSMHMFSVDHDFYGGHGIVGAQVSLGTGLALANKYKENGKVCFTYFGDGAANQGQVYESFNMAELWKLPVIYIIENNRYAMGTSVTRSSAQTDFSKRGVSFNIPGEQVDGMDVRAVKAAGDKAVKWCREGNGPFILEMQTYRYRGHSMSDPAKYRTREEVDKVRHDSDPIEQVRNRLLADKVTEDELKKIDAGVREIVNTAADFAQNDPEPDVSELYTDIYR